MCLFSCFLWFQFGLASSTSQVSFIGPACELQASLATSVDKNMKVSEYGMGIIGHCSKLL